MNLLYIKQMIIKTELRKQAKEIRKSLKLKEISVKITENIMNFDVYKSAKNIMIFYPLKHEVNLLSLLKDKSKNFYLPKVEGENLLVCPYKAGEKLIHSAFRTEEPLTNPVDSEILDIVFVPALMADRNMDRLGYGGGFYDKFLSKNCKNAVKIIAIPSQLIADEIPSESYDEKVDFIVSEKEVIS